jgi:hypothetical protein
MKYLNDLGELVTTYPACEHRPNAMMTHLNTEPCACQLNSPQSQHLTGATPTLDGRRDYRLDIRNAQDVLVARYFLYDSPLPLLDEGVESTMLTGIASEAMYVLTRVVSDVPHYDEYDSYVEGMDEAA